MAYFCWRLLVTLFRVVHALTVIWWPCLILSPRNRSKWRAHACEVKLKQRVRRVCAPANKQEKGGSSKRYSK